MNLTGIIRLQEKIARSKGFTAEEIDFILDATAVAVLANRLLSAMPVTLSCGCIFCDLDIELHEDAEGFHHVVKGKRISCTRVKP